MPDTEYVKVTSGDAGVGRLEELGSQFRAATADPSLEPFAMSWSAIAFFAGMAVAIIGAIIVFRYHKRFYPPFKPDEDGLFHNLAYSHRLERRELKLLKRIAKQKGITPAAKIFLLPETLQNAVKSSALTSDKKELLERIRTKIMDPDTAAA